jgi:hypothetical protein
MCDEEEREREREREIFEHTNHSNLHDSLLVFELLLHIEERDLEFLFLHTAHAASRISRNSSELVSRIFGNPFVLSERKDYLISLLC